MNDWLSHEGLIGQAIERLERGEDLCIATLINAKGSVPQDLGAKILISTQGESIGTIGGGKVEAAVLAQARLFLSQRSSPKVNLFIWNLQRDLGMSCGGEVTVLFEVTFSQPPLIIGLFGAGHVAQALVPLLLKLNVKVFWFDDRQEWLDKGPLVSSKLCKMKLASEASLKEAIDQLPPKSFVISLTKGHRSDLEVLRLVLHRGEFSYVGVIGSRTKAKSLRSQLLEEGYSSAQVEAFFCPIGEDFGSNSPEEIAFSIIAQVLRVRDQVFLRVSR